VSLFIHIVEEPFCWFVVYK